MRYLGTLWERCNNGDIRKGEWDYERRLTIDGVVYNDEDIIKVTHDKGLVANSFSIGNTISGSVKATVIPHTDHTVRRNGKVLLELRIMTLNDGATDWFEFGHYYINSAKRERDKWTIEGYDAINQLETPFVTSNTNWPQSCTNAVNQILNFLNIDLDPRTSINSSLQIQDPTEFTMREVLGYIGGLHGGNWYITETNKLRLIIPSLGTKVATVLPGNTKKLVDSGVMNFDKIILKFSSSVKDKYTSGSGRNEFEVYNPWGTQSTADYIRSVLRNYEYYPGEYKSTEINPAVELGDTIEIDGKLVNLWQVSYSTRIYADIYIPDQTDKYRDTYNFAVDANAFDWDYGGGGDYGYLQDRVSMLEDMLGIRGCVIISYEEYQSKNYRSSCMIIPQTIDDGGNGLTIQGSYLFENTDIVNKVINNNRDLRSINGMFRGSLVSSIDLSQFNAENVVDMRDLFGGASARVINLSNFNTSRTVDMNSMFHDSQATTLDLSSFNTSNVTDMSYMFDDSQVTTLDLSNFDTSSVTNMRRMFANSKVATIDLSSFDTSNVTDMNQMFHDSQATTLDVSSFNTSNVTNMSSMFTYMSNIEELDLSSFNLDNIELETSMIPGRFIYDGRSWITRWGISFNPLTVYCRTESDLNKMKDAYFMTYGRYNYTEPQSLVTFLVK